MNFSSAVGFRAFKVQHFFTMRAKVRGTFFAPQKKTPKKATRRLANLALLDFGSTLAWRHLCFLYIVLVLAGERTAKAYDAQARLTGLENHFCGVLAVVSIFSQ